MESWTDSKGRKVTETHCMTKEEKKNMLYRKKANIEIAALKTCFSTVTNTVITMICQNFQRAARHFDSHVRTNTATTPLHTHTHKQKASFTSVTWVRWRWGKEQENEGQGRRRGFRAQDLISALHREISQA